MLAAVIAGVPTWWFAYSVLMERWPRRLFGIVYWQISAAVLIAFVAAGVALAVTDLVFQ